MTDSETTETQGSPTVVVRPARPADAAAVTAFTQNTWGDRHEDYIPRVFPEWANTSDPGRETLVATLTPDAIAERGPYGSANSGREQGDTTVEGDGTGAADPGDPEAVVGCIQGVLLSEWEAWGQGIRVDPVARGFGVGSALSTAALEWAREAGATVCRNMVFSWNIAGLGQSRAVGFEPATEFRFAEPEPAAKTNPEANSTFRRIPDPDPNSAWAFWTDSDARDHLRGLALDDEESWACSMLTRERLTIAADAGRLLAVADTDGRLAGMTVRTRVTEQAGDDDQTRVAVYGAAAWRDVAAAGALYNHIAADAASEGADATRVLIPETVTHVSDTGANRISVAGEPDFVLSADLTEEGSVHKRSAQQGSAER